MIHHVLDRQFRPTTINAAWVSDIAYAGWLYPAAVMDLYSRKIVGWAMAPSTHARAGLFRLEDGHYTAPSAGRVDCAFGPWQVSTPAPPIANR
ncbi:hypothetical protein FHP91_10075 [Denitromonas halophila]|uniref:DDE-type integrase/transposase/recombinase n=1 Tax=Denitromonas halophila TaxID=1629404 RepID=A0A557QWD8_9RHOO|nr:hypothetical protein FHP91_10075 [Denitromonas halophila]